MVGEFASLEISFADLPNKLIVVHVRFTATVQVPLFLRASGRRFFNRLPVFFPLRQCRNVAAWYGRCHKQLAW
jgi:hypothetical protein